MRHRAAPPPLPDRRVAGAHGSRLNLAGWAPWSRAEPEQCSALFPMAERQCDSMLAMLQAMKPGLLRDEGPIEVKIDVSLPGADDAEADD
jgi:hypothetical protein